MSLRRIGLGFQFVQHRFGVLQVSDVETLNLISTKVGPSESAEETSKCFNRSSQVTFELSIRSEVVLGPKLRAGLIQERGDSYPRGSRPSGVKFEGRHTTDTDLAR